MHNLRQTKWPQLSSQPFLNLGFDKVRRIWRPYPETLFVDMSGYSQPEFQREVQHPPNPL